jgi:hypothetical protein
MLIRYNKACVSYLDFLDIGLLLTHKLMIVRLKSAFMVSIDTEHLSRRWHTIYLLCHQRKV